MVFVILCCMIDKMLLLTTEDVLEDSLVSLPRPSTAIGQPDVIPVNNESSPPHNKSSQAIPTFNQLEREANSETRSLNVEDWLRSSMSSGTLLPPFEMASQMLVQEKEKEKDVVGGSSLLQADPSMPSSSAVLQISPSTSVDDVLREMAELGVLVSPTPSAPRISVSILFAMLCRSIIVVLLSITCLL